VVLFSGLFITKLKPARLYIIHQRRIRTREWQKIILSGRARSLKEDCSAVGEIFPLPRLKMMFTYVVLNREV